MPTDGSNHSLVMPTSKYKLFDLIGSVAVSDATFSTFGTVDGNLAVSLLMP